MIITDLSPSSPLSWMSFFLKTNVVLPGDQSWSFIWGNTHMQAAALFREAQGIDLENTLEMAGLASYQAKEIVGGRRRLPGLHRRTSASRGRRSFTGQRGGSELHPSVLWRKGTCVAPHFLEGIFHVAPTCTSEINSLLHLKCSPTLWIFNLKGRQSPQSPQGLPVLRTHRHVSVNVCVKKQQRDKNILEICTQIFTFRFTHTAINQNNFLCKQM